MTRVLVITGGIGSGKSEVCRILAEEGFTAQYDADSRAKALYTAYPDLLDSIERSLGEGFRDGEGSFLPARLAERIFSDKEALNVVEQLLFPVLIRDFGKFAECSGMDAVVFESATVLEKAQFEGFGDKVVLVDAPFDMRLRRACARDGASREAILARMRSQKLMNELSAGRKDPRVDYVIMNDSSFDVLRSRTLEMIKTLIEDKDEN